MREKGRVNTAKFVLTRDHSSVNSTTQFIPMTGHSREQKKSIILIQNEVLKRLLEIKPSTPPSSLPQSGSRANIYQVCFHALLSIYHGSQEPSIDHSHPICGSR